MVGKKICERQPPNNNNSNDYLHLYSSELSLAAVYDYCAWRMVWLQQRKQVENKSYCCPTMYLTVSIIGHRQEKDRKMSLKLGNRRISEWLSIWESVMRWVFVLLSKRAMLYSWRWKSVVVFLVENFCDAVAYIAAEINALWSRDKACGWDNTYRSARGMGFKGERFKQNLLGWQWASWWNVQSQSHNSLTNTI